MERIKIKELLRTEPTGTEVVVKGWVRTFRNNQFAAVNDGSTLDNIQLVLTLDEFDDKITSRINPGAAISARGTVVESQGRGQRIEIKVKEIEVLGESDPEKYPLQPKKHSLEFLRENAHLRFRTNTFGAVFRIRHAASMAVHRFFDEKGFIYLHSPILTASDAEGAGELFRVSTLDAKHPPLTDDNQVDFKKDFFGKEAHLTVSGQLEAELGALALSDVYTFGPTFRAEQSHTTRHLAEFWMIEPEMAFADLTDNMNLAEKMLKYIIQYVMNRCEKDLAFLDARLFNDEKNKPQDQRSSMRLVEKLKFCLENDFERISYTDAIRILQNSKPNKKKKFQYVIEEWGADLQSEHERFLVEKHFKKPVIIYNYPKDIKAFYMRVNEDLKTVAAMDILFPGIGEIIGGAQREERLNVLLSRMEEMKIPEEELPWYLDIRKYGSCPHAGYGLGFERFVQFVTGMSNIRDVIPFPRTPGSIAF